MIVGLRTEVTDLAEQQLRSLPYHRLKKTPKLSPKAPAETPGAQEWHVCT